MNQLKPIKKNMTNDTIESVRLLNEFQEAAQENIIAAFVLKQNNISAVCMAFQVHRFARNQAVGFINFSLNEKEYKLKFDIDYTDSIVESQKEAYNNCSNNSFSFEYENKRIFKKHLCKKLGEIIVEHLAQIEEPDVFDILVKSQLP